MSARSRWHRAVGGALVVCLVTAPRVSFAQQAAPSAQPAPSAVAPTAFDPLGEEARVEFEAGLSALRDERYADALQSFERSYRARRVASVALNLGITLRALGRLVEARLRFQEFLEMANASQHERYDREVTGHLADLARRIVRVRVTISPDAARLSVDGRRAVQGADGLYALDPGEHRFELEHDGYEPARESHTLTPGGESDLAFTLRRRVVAPDPRVTVPGAPGETSPAITSRPAFWIILGVSIAAVATGVTVALVATRPVPPDGTNTGSLFETITLRRW